MGKVFQVQRHMQRQELMESMAGSRDHSGTVQMADTGFKERMVRNEAETLSWGTSMSL